MLATRMRMTVKELLVYYYYKLGEEYAAITGGWVVGQTFINAGGVITNTKNADHLYLKAANTATIGSNAQTSYTTDIKVDLTGINTLYFDCALTVTGTADTKVLYLQANSDKADYAGTYNASTSFTAAFAREEKSLDVSGLNGEYFVRAYIVSAKGAGGAGTLETQIYNVRWE